MIAAITQRVIQDDVTGEIRDVLCHDFYRLLDSLGYTLVVPLPTNITLAKALLERISPDILILSGGNDVEYGQDSSEPSSRPNLLRDSFERSLISWAIQNNTPLFGICRGMQMIHAYFGGKLRRIEGHARTIHSISLSNGTRYETVNSYHYYAISFHELSEQLKPVAFCSDGTVEAFVHDNYRISAIMWHPERESELSTVSKELLVAALEERQGGGQ